MVHIVFDRANILTLGSLILQCVHVPITQLLIIQGLPRWKNPTYLLNIYEVHAICLALYQVLCQVTRT